MKRILIAVGLSAWTAVSLQAQYAPGLTPMEMSKAWAFSADWRGFYDDNYLTEPRTFPIYGANGQVANSHPLATWGTQISPSAALNYSAENTLISASYIYNETWYANHSVSDSSHQFTGRLDHEFSERFKLAVTDAFVVAQEPTVLDPAIVSTPLRVPGNNVHNTGQLDFTAELTKDFDLHLGYGNSIYAYQQTARSVIGYPYFTNSLYPQPSVSAMLDRMDQTAMVDLRWKATHEFTGIFGYNFENIDYTSPEYIIFPTGTYGPAPGIYPPSANGQPSTPGYRSAVRNTDNHIIFVGGEESFTPELTASLRVGAEYLDYYNEQTSRVSPYVDASVSDQYMLGCSAQLGVKHTHNATDVVGIYGLGASTPATAPAPVLDVDTTAIYISDSHRLTERFTVSAMGQAQLSTFNGGGVGYNGESENFYVLQVNFAYHFNPNWLAEAGYNYSNLRSAVQFREYTRDFMYLGIRATY